MIVDGVSTPVLKASLLKTANLLRDMGELKSRQDQYDFVMKYLKDFHGIDAVIKVEGEEAIILLPPIFQEIIFLMKFIVQAEKLK